MKTEGKNTISLIAEDIDSYLRDAYNYKRKICSCSNKNITARRAMFDLYFRYNVKGWIWTEDMLIIARIYFHTGKKGNGRSLLQYLVDISDKYNFTKIALECTNTTDGKRFAKRYKFENLDSEKHWAIHVDTLKKHL